MRVVHDKYTVVTIYIVMGRDPHKRMIGLWVHEDMKHELSSLAAEENRTTSNFVETVLMKYLNDRKIKGGTKTVQPEE